MEHSTKKNNGRRSSNIFTFAILLVITFSFSSPVDLFASIFSKTSSETCGQITVRWNKAEGAEEYELYRGDELVYRGKNTKFIDIGLVLGRSYSYKLRASNRVGKSPFSATVHFVARDLCRPDRPSDLFVHSYPCGGRTIVHWSSVPQAERYELSRGRNVIYTGNLSYFFDSNLGLDRRYTYTVRAWSNGGWGDKVSASGRSSGRCPPFSPDEPFADKAELGTEGDMSVSLRSVPRDGVRVRTSADVISFDVSAYHSDMIVRRIDVFFDKDPGRYLDKIEIKMGMRVVASIPVSSETVSAVGRGEYRMRFSDLFLEVKEDKATRLTVRVSSKCCRDHAQEMRVYLRNNSIRAEDTLFMSHTLPTAGGGPAGHLSRIFIIN